ncbi:hypothetical protein HNQ50_000312 [Silvimonas terrae]|uniref:Tail assembly chaperone n=1 Tax=Silvimonas terrae TaxID=300266 RepID=A0A840RB89_9NEIS|nr:hypothetical protein [Silvimonas terrae]MBB5189602.1 hypothetical protein [Silvimonas terrae]
MTTPQIQIGAESQGAAAAMAPEMLTVTDSAGRQIVLKKPGVLAQYRAVEAMGASAENRVYMQMVLPIFYVQMIDGLPVATPSTKPQIEALIQRLDEHGLAAVIDGMAQMQPKSEDEHKDAVKD